MHVIFNHTGEFLAEARLAQDAGVVEGGVVRVTFKIVSHTDGNFATIILQAGFLCMGVLYLLEDRLKTELASVIEVEGLPASAQELRKRLESNLREFGFTVRHGMIVL